MDANRLFVSSSKVDIYDLCYFKLYVSNSVFQMKIMRTAVLISYKASLKLDSAHFVCEYMENFTSVLNWQWIGSGSLFVRDRKGGTSGWHRSGVLDTACR